MGEKGKGKGVSACESESSPIGENERGALLARLRTLLWVLMGERGSRSSSHFYPIKQNSTN